MKSFSLLHVEFTSFICLAFSLTHLLSGFSAVADFLNHLQNSPLWRMIMMWLSNPQLPFLQCYSKVRSSVFVPLQSNTLYPKCARLPPWFTNVHRCNLAYKCHASFLALVRSFSVCCSTHVYVNLRVWDSFRLSNWSLFPLARVVSEKYGEIINNAFLF